jgi:hypothetical protein
MKRSLIPWHVFHEALVGQNFEGLESWLCRWGFTNDGVILIGGNIGSQPQLPFDSQDGTHDVPVELLRASLQELVEFLTSDTSPLMAQASEPWCYEKEL